MSHDTLVTSVAEEWFAQLTDLVSSYGAADERARRNAALARSLSSRSGACCAPEKKSGHGARIVFPLVRAGTTVENRFVLFPLVYAVFRLESRFLPFVEVVEGPAPRALLAPAQALAAFDSTFASLGDLHVVTGASLPPSTEFVARHPEASLLHRVRLSVLKSYLREAGGAHDVRLSCAVDSGVPSCEFGDDPRERFIPVWKEGMCVWRRWNTYELSAADVAQLQN